MAKERAEAVAEEWLWHASDRPMITTRVGPDVRLGDLFRVVRITHDEDQELVTLERVTEDRGKAPE